MKKLSILMLALGISCNVFADDLTTVSVTAQDCDNGSPCNVIKTSANTLSQAINQNISNQQAQTMIQNSIIPQFDFTLMTRYAMGRNWQQANSTQQAQIVDLFKQMLINSYSTALSKFKGAQVAITNSKLGDKPNKAMVNSTITMQNSSGKAQPVNVEYDLAKIGSAWKIYDVKIENASIVATYRNQFNDIIQKDGVNGLISQLQTKVNNIKAK